MTTDNITSKKTLTMRTENEIEIYVYDYQKTPEIEKPWICIGFRNYPLNANCHITTNEAREIACLLLTAADRAEGIETEEHIYLPAKTPCGKINSGHACKLPAGSKCPDCSTSLIDYPDPATAKNSESQP